MRQRGYWDEVADLDDALPAGWRRHARQAHLDLLAAWVGRPEGRWAKTDLYEERTAGRALVPSLGSAWWLGFDLSPAVATQARDAACREVVVAEVRSLPLADGSLDGILSTSTLDHFTDAEQIEVALRELRRVLRAGGRLVLTLDNRRNPLIRARNALPRPIAARTGLVPFEVGATLDARQGAEALRRAGFAVLAATHLLHAPHVVGTRPARWRWWERRVLPAFERLAGTGLAPWTGHYVAFLAEPA